MRSYNIVKLYVQSARTYPMLIAVSCLSPVRTQTLIDALENLMSMFADEKHLPLLTAAVPEEPHLAVYLLSPLHPTKRSPFLSIQPTLLSTGRDKQRIKENQDYSYLSFAVLECQTSPLIKLVPLFEFFRFECGPCNYQRAETC